MTICASRELTKKFEETLRGTAAELLQVLGARKEILGEWVVCVSGESSTDENNDEGGRGDLVH